MSARRFDQERFEELRTLRALGTLSAAECREFTALLSERAGIDLEADELTVAAIELASVESRLEPLPAPLMKRLHADAKAHFAARGSTEGSAQAPAASVGAAARSSAAPEPAHEASTGGVSARTTPIHELRPRGSRPKLAWVVAAAALVVALLSWWPRLSGSTTSSPADGRAALLAQKDVLTVPWSGTDFAKGADGDVVWDGNAQRGFMRIRGLAKNDPTREQYQLWIFDETQKHPIDGGVFDIGADGELVIPIDPKLFVAKPTLFAVTVEKPGGVVVSAQEKIVLAGKI